MAGSLKVTCTLGQTAYAYLSSGALATLNGAAAWTIAFFYEFVSWGAGAGGRPIQIGSSNPLLVSTAGSDTFQTYVVNAGAGKNIGKTVGLDTSGHHICISGSETGTSRIYIDGIQNATTLDLGILLGSDSPVYVGWDDSGHAATLYLRDLAVWGSHAVDPDEALALSTGALTPAMLATPADNYWTLQGPAGAVTAGTQGLDDSLGSVPLNGVFGSGTLTYDVHEIVSVPSVPVFFLTPYVDTTGYLLFVPFYLNPDTSGGGPVLPTSISTAPVFTVAGSTVVPTQLPLDTLGAFVAYQFADPVMAGQVVTMAAAPGWAVTAAGVVGGTSDAGLGSDPLTVTNYAGAARDDEPVTPTLRIGSDVNGPPNARASVCCVVRNLARRIVSLDPGYPLTNNWQGNGTITGFDINNLPTGFTGGVGFYLWAFVAATTAGNGIDNNGIPRMFGTFTLIHGDASPGVDASTKVMQVDLTTISTGWTVGPATIVNEGEWDGSEWHQITKTYPVTWSPDGGFLNPDILLQISRLDGSGDPAVGGPIAFPILANGQSELGVFEADPDDLTIPATIPTDYLDLFDPLAISPSWLKLYANLHVIRWMPSQLLLTNTGSGNLVYPGDTDVRKSTDFLQTNTVTGTFECIQVDPVSLVDDPQIIIDYLNGDPSGTLPYPITPTRPNCIWAILTTSIAHGMRTGDRSFVTIPKPGGAPSPFKLTANIDAVQTVLPLSAVTNLAAGAVLQIDAPGSLPPEQVQVVSIAGLNVTVIRGTRGTTAQATPSSYVLYPQIRGVVSDSTYITLTANIDDSQTTIPVSAFTNINGDVFCIMFESSLYQIGSSPTAEQIQVNPAIRPTSTTVDVIRGVRGTTAQSAVSGTVVYPASDINVGGINDVFLPVSTTEILVFLAHRAVPRNAPRSHTLLYPQTYIHDHAPAFQNPVPPALGSIPYDMCSRATSLVAAAKVSGECICWVSVPMFAVDAAVTDVVNQMIPDFAATPGMTLVLQCSNEVFNGGFDQKVLAEIFAPVAPNPESSGTGFGSWNEYWASRQHHYTRLARDAFTAASLDPDRVVWYQNSTLQGVVAPQSLSQECLAYCQRYSLPVRNISLQAYADMSDSMAATYVSWLPASTGVTGATATWDLATTRKVHMSNYRASMRHGIVLAACFVDVAKYMSRYNNGISVDGIAPANTNPVRGRMCIYEGSTTLPIPYPNNAFPQHTAWTMDLQYDPEWYQTEWAYYQALQDMPYRYALLMGDNFPDPTDAIMEFTCYFSFTMTSAPAGPQLCYSFPMYRWQQQRPGYGDGSHGGVVNRLDSWDPTTPVSHDLTANGGVLPPTFNESVRGQVALDWMAATLTPTPTSTGRGTGAALLPQM